MTFLHQLNEVQDGLLLAGTADGAVRVWRNYAHKGEQRLATAWQVGTINTLCPLSSPLVSFNHQTSIPCLPLLDDILPPRGQPLFKWF